jgi:DDE superfamily endonuclease
MPDIIIVLACLSQCLDTTTLRQLRRVTEAMLAMTGRVTMRGLSRWAGKGGSYRTIQRFFVTSISWATLQWVLIRHHLLDPDDVILRGGDDVVVPKAGKHTHGLDRFFSSLYGKRVPGLGFPTLSRCRTRKNYIPSPEHLVDSTPFSREGCQWNQSALNAWTISAWWLRLSKI